VLSHVFERKDSSTAGTLFTSYVKTPLENICILCLVPRKSQLTYIMCFYISQSFIYQIQPIANTAEGGLSMSAVTEASKAQVRTWVTMLLGGFSAHNLSRIKI